MDDHGVEALEQHVLLAEQVVLLDLAPALLALLGLVVLAVAGGLQLVLRAGGALVEVVLVVVVVAVDDGDELLELLAGLDARGRDLLIADVEEVLRGGGRTLRVSSVSIM